MPNATKPSIDLSKLTPQQLVETYYKSLSVGDLSTARSCMDEEYAKQFVKLEDSDFKNLRELSDLKVKPEAPIKLHGKNYDEVQVVAEYIAVYKKVITSDSGRQIRFVYVGKKEKDSPWRIISIGTGP